VLLVPRVLPVELCAELVAGFPRWNPAPSPMPSADGVGLEVVPERKARLDAEIGDADLEQEVIASISRRVLPEVQKAFCYQATRFERLKLVCYPGEQGGHFAAHRDNTAPQTAHRRFALTLDLNRGDYRGGELVFPEYGSAVYAPSRGGAVVFSGSLAHAVQPVSQGERYTLISFMYGETRPRKAGQASEPAS
jgi:predicted 2-oxoglutarate/Fe(II)-dependent dioxygenase YbiX